METGDQSAGAYAGGCAGENPLVRPEVEDRNFSQNFKIGLPRRTGQTANRRAFDEVDSGVLHSELASILDDDGPKNGPGHYRRCGHYGARADAFGQAIWKP